MRRKVLSIFLVFLLALPLCIRIRASGLEWTALAELLDAAPDGLLQSNALTPGDSLSDWVAILAGRSGETGGAEAYLEKLWKEVSRRYEQTGGLDAVQATAWHRTALTVMALGADPTCFGTDAQGQAIDLIADGTYAWDTTESLGTQGLNGWIFALITLDAGAYSVPENAGYTRQEILDAILAAQEPDGGFGLVAGASDVDITAMALQALAPYQERYASEVEQALAYLSAEQTAQGDFISYGTASAESCAQVVMALCALGVDPRTDDRFVKAGGSALDGLLLYQTDTGAFCHILGDEANLLATEQAGLALCALGRLEEGAGRLYDFTDTPLQAYEPKQTRFPYGIVAAVAVLGVGLVILWVWKGTVYGRNNKKTDSGSEKGHCRKG